MAVWSIVRFNVLSNYKIEVFFADGTSGVADLSPRLSQGPLGDGFDALCDATVFAKVYLCPSTTRKISGSWSTSCVNDCRRRRRFDDVTEASGCSGI